MRQRHTCALAQEKGVVPDLGLRPPVTQGGVYSVLDSGMTPPYLGTLKKARKWTPIHCTWTPIHGTWYISPWLPLPWYLTPMAPGTPTFVYSHPMALRQP